MPPKPDSQNTFRANLIPAVLLLVSFFINILASPAHSQRIIDYTVRNGTSQSGCAVVIRGTIESGLTVRVQDMHLERLYNGMDAPVVCLDSEGGNLEEAVELLDYFIESQILTYVDEGDTCLSACAVAFLGGSARFGNGQMFLILSRAIHPNAVIGFHAPMLSAPQGVYTQDELNDTFTIGVEAARVLTRLNARNLRGVPLISDPLLFSILNTSPNEMFVVENIIQARAFRIAISEEANLNSHRETAIFQGGGDPALNVCDNVINAYLLKNSLLTDESMAQTLLGQQQNHGRSFRRLPQGEWPTVDISRYLFNRSTHESFFGPYESDAGANLTSYVCGVTQDFRGFSVSIYDVDYRYGTMQATHNTTLGVSNLYSRPMGYPIEQLSSD